VDHVIYQLQHWEESERSYHLLDSTNAEVRTWTPGPYTSFIAAANGKIFGGDYYYGYVRVYDATTTALLAEVPVSSMGTTKVVPTPDGSRVLVSGGDKVYVINTSTLSVEQTFPYNNARGLTATDTTAYIGVTERIGSSTVHDVYALELNTGAVTQLLSDRPGPTETLSVLGSRLYVAAAQGAFQMTAYDRVAGSVLGSIALPGTMPYIYFMSPGAGGASIYLAYSEGSPATWNVFAIDPVTLARTTVATGSGNLYQIGAGRSGNKIWISTETGLYEVDPSTGGVTQITPKMIGHSLFVGKVF
jgi:hypothetical protein